MATTSSPPTLSVLTLNVWGLKFISKDRTPRIAAIAEYLATHSEPTMKPGTGFDIVCLQECWVQEDFDTIKGACKDVFPYSRYFHTYVTFLFSFFRLCRSWRFFRCRVNVVSREFLFAVVVMCCHIPFLESWRSYVALSSMPMQTYIMSTQSLHGNPSLCPAHCSLVYSGALGSGLAILTKFPIISAQALPYSLSGLPLAVIAGDFFVNKAAGSVVVLHPELGEVEIWNTHVRLGTCAGCALSGLTKGILRCMRRESMDRRRSRRIEWLRRGSFRMPSGPQRNVDDT